MKEIVDSLPRERGHRHLTKHRERLRRLGESLYLRILIGRVLPARMSHSDAWLVGKENLLVLKKLLVQKIKKPKPKTFPGTNVLNLFCQDVFPG